MKMPTTSVNKTDAVWTRSIVSAKMGATTPINKTNTVWTRSIVSENPTDATQSNAQTDATGHVPTTTQNIPTNAIRRAPTNPMPQRKSPRAAFHDYNGGVYFITICTAERQHYFGEITDGKMQLSPLGQCLNDNAAAISQHLDDVEMPVFVVMPNHFHAIVHIKRTDATKSNGGTNVTKSDGVGTRSIVSENPTDATGRVPTTTQNIQTNAIGRVPTMETKPIHHQNNRLAVVVGSIKAHVSRFARRNHITFGWQSRYHDHIIRDLNDWHQLSEYILHNPAHWADDCFAK